MNEELQFKLSRLASLAYDLLAINNVRNATRLATDPFDAAAREADKAALEYLRGSMQIAIAANSVGIAAIPALMTFLGLKPEQLAQFSYAFVLLLLAFCVGLVAGGLGSFHASEASRYFPRSYREEGKGHAQKIKFDYKKGADWENAENESDSHRQKAGAALREAERRRQWAMASTIFSFASFLLGVGGTVIVALFW